MSDQNCQHVWMELHWILVILRRSRRENFSNIYLFTVLEMLENAEKKIVVLIHFVIFFLMVLLDHYVISRFVFVPWSSEADDFKNILCGCYAITDLWKLVCFNVILSIIMMWRMQKIVRWHWQYCNVMVEWASVTDIVTAWPFVAMTFLILWNIWLQKKQKICSTMWT